MLNEPHNLSSIWKTKTKEILKSSHLSVAKKILAYKIFLRPMLIFEWFERRENDMKRLEIQALKRIFATNNERSLYKRYTDIDVTKYMKLQEIRWKRATGSDFGNLRRMLQELSRMGDPSPYFTDGAGRDSKNNKHHCRFRCCRCRQCPCNQHHRHTHSSHSMSTCMKSASSTRPMTERSTRRNKKRIHYRKR